jgi:DNA-binding MarR family transcriptional regulator
MKRGSAPPGFDLGRFLPYLITRAGARLAGAFADDIAPLGVGLQEWRVLAALRAHGPQRLGDLAQLTSIDVSTLSRLVGRMARAKLAARTRESGDRRAVRIALAPKGRRTAEAIIPLARRYDRTALAGFAAADADRLRAMLKRVYRNLDALTP